MNLFHLERCDRASHKKGSREELDGSKVHVRRSTDICHSNSLCEVQFEGLGFGLLGLGWESASGIRNLHEHVLPARMQKERDQGLAQLPCSPNCFHTKS